MCGCVGEASLCLHVLSFLCVSRATIYCSPLWLFAIFFAWKCTAVGWNVNPHWDFVYARFSMQAWSHGFHRHSRADRQERGANWDPWKARKQPCYGDCLDLRNWVKTLKREKREKLLPFSFHRIVLCKLCVCDVHTPLGLKCLPVLLQLQPCVIQAGKWALVSNIAILQEKGKSKVLPINCSYRVRICSCVLGNPKHVATKCFWERLIHFFLTSLG